MSGSANMGEGFAVSFAAYCGMAYYLGVALTRTEARSTVARRIRAARKRGQAVCILRKGYTFEVCEPEGCTMVPDNAGILSIEDPPVYTCRECGSTYTGEGSRAAVRECCSEDSEA